LAEEYARKINPWLQKLKENGIAPYITTKGSIAGDGLSRVIHKDQELLPYRLHSDMLVHCTRVLEQQNNAFLMAYYSGIDNLAHAYGPYSQEVDFEINSIECNLKNFFNLLTLETKRKTLLLILADHGVVETGRIYYLKDYPEIGSRLMLPPVGDSRATFLFTKPDQKNTLPEVFRKNVEKINLYDSAELSVKGAFGNVANRETLRYSVGDFTALSVEKNILQYPYFEEDRFHEQLGAHGGMTAEEIIVPLLSIRLSKL
jgi:predicted AlkP superfamily pyrophosphatase or phosphodiesterase